MPPDGVCCCDHDARISDELCCEYRLSSSPQDGRSTMMYAAAKGEVGLVCQLVELGVEIEHVDKVA